MLFDDRLATVLRTRATSGLAGRTQYRQLLDLLGAAPHGAQGAAIDDAFARLAELDGMLPARARAAIVRETAPRLRSARLVAHLGAGDPLTAAAVLETAPLSGQEWLALIPRLPVTSLGYLRARSDLPEIARPLLERLGVRKLALPAPDTAHHAPADTPSAASGPAISDLVRRIEAFRQSRQNAPASSAPRLPLEDEQAPGAPGTASCDFSIGTDGRVTWASGPLAPLLVGLALPRADRIDARSLAAMRGHLPISGGMAYLPGPPAIAGEWQIDAAPQFANAGAFAGYIGRLRRRAATNGFDAHGTAAGQRLRQALHELRTPVGAIQGFAEIIQQQLVGEVPNAYRALAAAIGVDAARLLSCFEEIERLARMDGRPAMADAGSTNLRLVIERTLQRLEGVLRARGSKLRLLVSGRDFAIPMEEHDAALLAWRICATLGGALAPGEVIEIILGSEKGRAVLTADLPLALAAADDVFAASAQPGAVVTAGMFGTGFTLRLARAEARAFGGALRAEDERLVLELPNLAAPVARHSGPEQDGAEQAERL